MTAATDRLTRPWESRYEIRDTTVLAEAKELRVLDMTLMPRQSVPWHRHPRNDDLFIGLRGEFRILYGEAGEGITVHAGERFNVPCGVAHSVVNASTCACQFLVIQGIGEYDYLPVDRGGK